jgi:hypothetical protein
MTLDGMIEKTVAVNHVAGCTMAMLELIPIMEETAKSSPLDGISR